VNAIKEDFGIEELPATDDGDVIVVGRGFARDFVLHCVLHCDIEGAPAVIIAEGLAIESELLKTAGLELELGLESDESESDESKLGDSEVYCSPSASGLES
jgi:hypothetical protein